MTRLDGTYTVIPELMWTTKINFPSTFLVLTPSTEFCLKLFCNFGKKSMGINTHFRIQHSFLGAFAKLRKPTITFVMSVRPHGTNRLPPKEFSRNLIKVKSAVGAFYSTTALWLIVLLTPKGVPSFISRGAAHKAAWATSASEGRNYRWNLANNPVIHVSC
jgi:hypothetical protein